MTQPKARHTFLYMPKRISRVQKAQLEPRFRLTDEEALLVELNNDAYPTGHRSSQNWVDKDVLALFVKCFQQLNAALDTARSKSSDFMTMADDAEVTRALVAVNRLFDRYKMTPAIFPNRNNRQGWKQIWLQIEGENVRPNREFLAVMTIIELAQEGRLSLLKQCAHCKRWLFGRSSDQRFCSGTSCKEDFHKTNPEDKARRREWAKKNYWLHKTKNIK